MRHMATFRGRYGPFTKCSHRVVFCAMATVQIRSSPSASLKWARVQRSATRAYCSAAAAFGWVRATYQSHEDASSHAKRGLPKTLLDVMAAPLGYSRRNS